MPGGKIQISLESGSVAILSFKDGQFSGINTLQNKKSHHFLHAVQCWNKMEEGLIVLEQNCENDLTCSKLVTLTKNNQQNTYEASSDRGFITKSWAFCDRDEPDAFQVLTKQKNINSCLWLFIQRVGFIFIIKKVFKIVLLFLS